MARGEVAGKKQKGSNKTAVVAPGAVALTDATASTSLRNAVRGLYGLSASLRAYRFPSKSLVVSGNGKSTATDASPPALALEQLWGQLAVGYRGPLSQLTKDVDRYASPEFAEAAAEANAGARKEQLKLARQQQQAKAKRVTSRAAFDASVTLGADDDEDLEELRHAYGDVGDGKKNKKRGKKLKGAQKALANPFVLGDGEGDEDEDLDERELLNEKEHGGFDDGMGGFDGEDAFADDGTGGRGARRKKRATLEKKRAALDTAPTMEEERALFADLEGRAGSADEESAPGDEEDELAMGDLDDDEDDAVMAELYGGGDDDDALFAEDERYDGEEDEEEDEEDAADDGGAFGGDEGFGDDDAAPFDESAANPFAAGGGDDDDDLGGLTAFQKAERERKKALRDAEDERLLGQHWAMAGEVGATARPRDSLLDTQLDFEHAVRPVPEITEAVTASLETRIKARIKEANYDDVVRIVKRTTAGDLVTSKRDAEVDAQKSKMSLMDLYEKDFLEKQRKADDATASGEVAEPLTEVERDELKALQMWNRLSQHLDALANFHFAPAPVERETEARVRAAEGKGAAIAIEAVGSGAGMTGDSALAPQDTFRPNPNKRLRGVAADEMSPGERQALRRAKKEAHVTGVERHEKQAKQLKKAQAAEQAKKQATAASA